MKTRTILVLVFSIFGLLAIAIGISFPRTATAASRAEFQITRSDTQGVEVLLRTEDFQVTQEPYSGENYQTLSFGGMPHSAEPGAPQLPLQYLLLGAPAGAQVEVRVIQDDPQPIPGFFHILPAPSPAPLTDDLQPGEWHSIANPKTYALNSLYPASPVRIADDAWLRDRRILRIELYPLQYNPAQGALLWHRELKVEVRFIGGDAAQAQVPQLDEDPFSRLLEHFIANDAVARNWRATTHLPVRDSHSNPGETLDGPAYKIVVDRDGIYQLTYSNLAAAGMNVEDVDPRTFRLTSQERDVALYVSGESDGSFDANDTVTFFGEKFNGDYLASLYASENRFWYTYTQQLSTGAYTLWHPENNAEMIEKYTDENVYWLTAGGSPSPRMITTDGDPTGSGAPTPSSYRLVKHAEQDNRWWTWHFQDEETWYWETATHPYQPYPRTYTTTLTALATEPFTATLRAAVGARASMDTLPNDHHTTFTLNDMATPLDDKYWEGKSRYEFEAQVAQSELNEGENQLIFNALADSAASRSFSFDWFEIEYLRRFVAEANQLSFPGATAGSWKYKVSGFASSAVKILDITDPLAPVLILNPSVAGVGGVYTATFAITHNDPVTYFVAGESSLQSPLSITYYEPPDLLSSANQADYLFIAHPDFLTATQMLADFRAAQGLSTVVVNIEDVYNIFGDGIVHPIAIKNLIAYTFSDWQPPAPQYVLLVGDGHWNFKNFNPGWYGSEPWFMPPYLGWVDPWQGEVDATNLLATVVGDDPLPDVLIGRLLVNSVAELNTVIDKTIAYEQTPPQDWQRRLLFIADNEPDPAGPFEPSAEAIINNYVPSTFTPDRIYTTDLCGPPSYGIPCLAARDAITATLDTTGTLILDYIGHGHIQRWAQEPIFRNSDVPYLDNGAMLPVIFSMTCMDNFWFGASLNGTEGALGPSQIELMVRLADRGAVAAFSPGGLGVGTGHDDLAHGFYGAIFDDGLWRLGPVSLSAKLSLYASGLNYDLLETFMVVGDPALHMLSPYGLTVTPTASAASALAGSTVDYSLGISNTGQVSDTIEITITGNVWTTTFPTAIGPLLPGEDQTVTISVQIPSGVPGGSVDSAQLLVISNGDISHRSTVNLETTADVFGLQLRPTADARIGLPGSLITYTLQITNTSNTSDTFDITLGAHNWTTTAPASTANLAPDESMSFDVGVAIPANASDYEADTVVVTLSSQADPSRQAMASLTTTARLFGLALTPAQSVISAEAGSTALHHFAITNTGGYTDDFSVALMDTPAWATNITPVSLGPLAPGAQAFFTVTVSIPAQAGGNEVDTIQVSVTSDSDPSKTDQSSLSTSVTPIYAFALSPEASAQSSSPGTTITYTLTITNQGNITDSYLISLGSHNWPVAAPGQTGTLRRGESVSIAVVVSIPESAQDGETDVVAVTLISQSSAGVAHASGLTTTAESPLRLVFLPLVRR